MLFQQCGTGLGGDQIYKGTEHLVTISWQMTFANIQQMLLGKLTCLWKEVSLVPNSFLTFINNFQTSGAGKFLLERVTEFNTWGFVGCSVSAVHLCHCSTKEAKGICKQVWLSSNKTVFMVTDTWISYVLKNLIWSSCHEIFFDFLNNWKMLKQF